MGKLKSVFQKPLRMLGPFAFRAACYFQYIALYIELSWILLAYFGGSCFHRY